MARTKLKGLKTIDDLKAGLPHATRARRTSKGEGTGLMLMVPPVTIQALRMRAAEGTTPVRALVLDALRKAGYAVPADELVDRRRA